MSVTRMFCFALAALAILAALCIPSAQLVQDEVEPVDPATLPPYEPVARVGSLMTGFGTALGEINELLPQHDNEHRLRGIAAWSEVIAELSNAHTRYRRHPEYLKMAANTRSLALDVALEARAAAPDEMELGTLVMQLDRSCATCHDSDY